MTLTPGLTLLGLLLVLLAIPLAFSFAPFVIGVDRARLCGPPRPRRRLPPTRRRSGLSSVSPPVAAPPRRSRHRPRRRSRRSCHGTSRPASAPPGRRPRGRPTSPAGRGMTPARPGSRSAPRHRSSGRAGSGRAPSAPSSAARTIDRVCAMFIRSPDPVRAAGPAGVDQPDGDVVAFEPLDQHPRVLAGVARHERRAEAGREGRLRLLDPDLGPGQLGGVAADEVVGGLLVAQPRIGGSTPNASAVRKHDRPRASRRSRSRRRCR